MSFVYFWNAWPKSERKGAKRACLAKWQKMNLDAEIDQILLHVEWMKTTDSWKKNNGEFIPAPLVYINQARWDGADVPEMTINLSVSFKDPVLQKMDDDDKKAVPMPKEVAEKLKQLRNMKTRSFDLYN